MLTNLIDLIKNSSDEVRQKAIIHSFIDSYGELIANDSSAWYGKFRKMARSPFSFYRGSAALFYADVSRDEDPFLNEQTSRVWIQGDLHASNFGTYMNNAGILVFDVNDFDEADVAPFTWDIKRLTASLALIGYEKALSDIEIREFIAQVPRGYAQQISRFAAGKDTDMSLTLANTKGTVQDVLKDARTLTRVDLLNRETEIIDGDRRFKNNKSISPVDDVLRLKLSAALKEYYNTIPMKERFSDLTYDIKDIAQRKGLGVGSAGLPVYSILLEGETQALENDIILSVKEAQSSAPGCYIKDEVIRSYFLHDGHRTAVSQRALQSHADPFLGHTTLDGKGMFVAEVSPYTADLDWDGINDFDDLLEVAESLGRCVAKIHCCSDDDSDQTLITYSIEHEINLVLDGREAEFIEYIVTFGESYGAIVRHDHNLFVDAFRNHLFPGI